MNISLKDKVAIITGASSGIGAGVAILFAKLGAKLIIHGRSEAGLDETIANCDESSRGKIVKVIGDVRNIEVLKQLVSKAIEAFGQINILVNNAGSGTADRIENFDIEKSSEIIDINLKATMNLTHLCIKHLIEQKGSIVNVTSLAATNQILDLLSYSASKAALDQFTKCVALEVGPKGVRINSINPGVVPTKIFNRALGDDFPAQQFYDRIKTVTPVGRNGTGEDCAKLIAFLASDHAGYITGDNIHIDGGLHTVGVSF